MLAIVSMRIRKLVRYMPMACLPMADWYVLRGDCKAVSHHSGEYQRILPDYDQGME